MASSLTTAQVLCSPCCAQYLGNPHHSQLGLGPLPEVLLDVHQSQESPVGKESIYDQGRIISNNVSEIKCCSNVRYYTGCVCERER